MTMSCRRAIELLIDYVGDDLPEEQRLLLQSHFQCCPPCLIYLETYQVTIKLTRQLPRDAPLPAEMESRLLDAVRALARPPEAAAGDQPPPRT